MLKAQILQRPKLAHLVGRGLFSLGGLLIVLGLIGRVAKTGVNTIRERGNLPSFSTLAELYPTLPVWFVPEGPLGFILAALFAALGVYLALQARVILRLTAPSRRKRR
jgi:hypothetical protein